MFNALVMKFLKSRLLNQRGGSLAQVMVISGMVSVFGLAVMQTAKNMNSLRQTGAVRESIQQFQESFSNVMLNDAACRITLNSNGITTRAQATNRSFTRLYNSNGAVIYQLFDPANTNTIYHGNIRIKSINFSDYNQAQNSGKLTIEMYKKYFHPSDDNQSVGINILGGDTITFELPLRVFFEIPEGAGGPAPTDTIESCFGEYKNEESGINPLEELCDDDLGGSYYNGRCIVTEYIMERTRCWTGGNCGDPDDGATAQRSICHNLGGRYDSSTGKCSPRFAGATACPDGFVLSGFNSEGRFVCIPNPSGTPSPPQCASGLASYDNTHGCCAKGYSPTISPTCYIVDTSYPDLDIWKVSGCAGHTCLIMASP